MLLQLLLVRMSLGSSGGADDRSPIHARCMGESRGLSCRNHLLVRGIGGWGPGTAARARIGRPWSDRRVVVWKQRRQNKPSSLIHVLQNLLYQKVIKARKQKLFFILFKPDRSGKKERKKEKKKHLKKKKKCRLGVRARVTFFKIQN